jgi:hypothetical protein
MARSGATTIGGWSGLVAAGGDISSPFSQFLWPQVSQSVTTNTFLKIRRSRGGTCKPVEGVS